MKTPLSSFCALARPSIFAKATSIIRNRWVSPSAACVPSDSLLSYLALAVGDISLAFPIWRCETLLSWPCWTRAGLKCTGRTQDWWRWWERRLIQPSIASKIKWSHTGIAVHSSRIFVVVEGMSWLTAVGHVSWRRECDCLPSPTRLEVSTTKTPDHSQRVAWCERPSASPTRKVVQCEQGIRAMVALILQSNWCSVTQV